MSGDKSGSPPCGIYVRIENFSDMPKTITALRQMAMVINRASGYAKNMAVVELAYNDEHKQEITDLIALIRAEGLVAIIRGGGADLDADGVMLERGADVSAMRAALGDDAIIGVLCTGKSEIETAIKNGADYIAIQADLTLMAWSKTQGDILCLVTGEKLTNDHCGALVRAGASFIDVTDYIWNYEKGVMQSTVNVLSAMNTANTLH